MKRLRQLPDWATPALVVLGVIVAAVLVALGAVWLAKSVTDNDDGPEVGEVIEQDFQSFQAQGSAADTPIPTFGLAVNPGWLSNYDSPSLDATGMWVYPTSPSTPYTAPNGKPASRYLLLDPRFTDSLGRKGNDEWWFIIERFWPADYKPDTNDRDANFHNAPGDAGNSAGAPGGIGWAPNFGSGVSSLAMDWPRGADRPNLCVMCGWKGRPEVPGEVHLPVPSRGQWHTYVVKWIAGRTDGSTVRPGAMTVWVDGNDTPWFDRGNLWTVQRAQSPADGQLYTQRWMVLWEGAYTIHLGVPYNKQFALTRIGRTFDEAVADVPVAQSNNSGSLYRAYGSFPTTRLDPNVAQRKAGQALLPPSLTGGGGGGGGTVPPEVAYQPSEPLVNDPVTFRVTNPTDGVTYTWDRNLDGVADGTGTTFTYSYVEAGTKTMRLYADGVLAVTTQLVVGARPVDALPLTITEQTAAKVSFKWTPPTDAVGYVFTVDGKRVSHTLDPTRSTVTFGKQTGSHVYAVSTLGRGPVGDETLVR